VIPLLHTGISERFRDQIGHYKALYKWFVYVLYLLFKLYVHMFSGVVDCFPVTLNV